MRVEFFCTGVAKPKGSSQAFNDSTGKAQLRPASSGERSWRAVVGASAREAMGMAKPVEGPCTVKLVVYSQRPKGHYGSGKNAGQVKATAPRRPTKAPDLDKTCRSVLDCLNGVVYRDDAQVAVLTAEKRWCDDEQPHVGVRVVVWWAGVNEAAP
jgi:Holliday junction resolvase RusA-like endonuclease